MSQFFPASNPSGTPFPVPPASGPAAFTPVPGEVPAAEPEGARAQAADPVGQAVHELKAAAEATAREIGQAAGEKLHELKEAAGRLLEGSGSRWKELADHATSYVRENPGKSVLAGLGAGFLIGLLFREK